MLVMRYCKRIFYCCAEKLHPKTVAVRLIKLYQYCLSPYLGGRCRFFPSCSNYAIDAFVKKGFVKGLALTLWRILRCNPFSAGGYDPVKTVKDC